MKAALNKKGLRRLVVGPFVVVTGMKAALNKKG